MSRHFKAIIPLLGESITMDDIDTKKGFRGMFSYDINRPYLDNHVFLVYSRVTTGTSIERDKRLKSLFCFYNRKVIKIKGISFLCYCFVCYKPSIKAILSNKWCISDSDKLRIFKFWDFTDDSINDYMLHPSDILFSETYEPVVIPEWDYVEEYEDFCLDIPVQENNKTLAARDE